MYPPLLIVTICKKQRGSGLTFKENGMALFLLEGHAVSALVYRWVAFMCSHSDAVQAAVVCCIGMMLTAFYHTLELLFISMILPPVLL